MGPRAFKLRPPPQHLCGSPGPVVREENWAGRGGGVGVEMRSWGRVADDGFNWDATAAATTGKISLSAPLRTPSFATSFGRGSKTKWGSIGEVGAGGREGAEPGTGQRLLLVQPENSCYPTSPKRKSRRRRRRTHNKHTPPNPPGLDDLNCLYWSTPPKHNGGSLTWSKAIRSETFV